ncbi:MSCRAMM family protein, partial [Paenibacillus senegalensis]|uniref:MSCRAMM family protein n=1 Tax=Paenibacillus senegalensis TaxID=1465766 RepID=UPI0002897FFF
GSVEIEKVDKDVHSIKLKGVKFELRDEANNVIKSDLTTDEKGQLSITDLHPGKYYLVETKAADHYELLTEPIEFTIEKSQTEPVKLLVENKMIS